jgi:hypothetical protein
MSVKAMHTLFTPLTLFEGSNPSFALGTLIA